MGLCRYVPHVRFFTGFLALILLVISAYPAKAGDAAPSCGRDVGDARVKDCLCRFVHRKRHHFRHWVWSGIFPGEGGFIPDPHYLCSKDGVFSDPVNELISVKTSRYAIVDVNPFFNDRSSEVLLLVKWHDEVLEYSLNFPKRKDVRAILGQPTPPPALVFEARYLMDHESNAELVLRRSRGLSNLETGEHVCSVKMVDGRIRGLRVVGDLNEGFHRLVLSQSAVN